VSLAGWLLACLPRQCAKTTFGSAPRISSPRRAFCLPKRTALSCKHYKRNHLRNVRKRVLHVTSIAFCGGASRYSVMFSTVQVRWLAGYQSVLLSQKIGAQRSQRGSVSAAGSRLDVCPPCLQRRVRCASPSQISVEPRCSGSATHASRTTIPVGCRLHSLLQGVTAVEG
jgi:hypothetical protein